MTEKKNALVIFTDLHLPYSPTTINLINTLTSEGYLVKIIAASPDSSYSDVKILNFDIIYIDEKGIKKSKVALLNLTLFFQRVFFKLFSNSEHFLLTIKAKLYIKEIKKQPHSIIIAVDAFAFWCVQKANKKAIFLSLEIPEKKAGLLAYEYINEIKDDSIQCVISQSAVRYQYLFNQRNFSLFILPNSPKYFDLNPLTIKRKKSDLIYCGSAINCFGIFSILDFLTDFKEYTLTIQGAIPADTNKAIELFYNSLLIEKRLILNSSYMSEDELVIFISSFRIGFVFYDFYRFPEMRKDNYYTAPSGKLHNYFNAGIPVICNELEGFKMVEDKKAGVLINNLSSIKIKNAIDAIENNYEMIVNNSKKLSLIYDYNKHINQISDFIKNL